MVLGFGFWFFVCPGARVRRRNEKLKPKTENSKTKNPKPKTNEDYLIILRFVGGFGGVARMICTIDPPV